MLSLSSGHRGLTITAVLLSLPAIFFGQPQLGIIEHFDTRLNQPTNITLGPDGAMWFSTAWQQNQIGRISATGVVTLYPGPDGTLVTYLAAGPDGALWFIAKDGGNVHDTVGRMTTGGLITAQYALPGTSLGSTGLIAGPDGALWFVEQENSKVGRITTAGVVTEFAIPTVNSWPSGITPGPDSALWFTERDGNKIGQITTAGVITEYPLAPHTAPGYITRGPDGALWFRQGGDSPKLVRVASAGSSASLVLPPTLSTSAPIAGPDGAFWMAVETPPELLRVSLTGELTEYPVPQTMIYDNPNSVALDTKGSIWYASSNSTAGGTLGQAIFTTAGLSVDPPEGSPLTEVTVTGTGFAGETVNLYVDNTYTNLVHSYFADASGSFSSTGSSHQALYGRRALVAVGQTSQKIGVAPFYTLNQIVLNTNTGSPGSSVTVQGVGFNANEQFYLVWDNPRQSLGLITADSRGSFYQDTALTFTIPADAPPGAHHVFTWSVSSSGSIVGANITVQ